MVWIQHWWYLLGCHWLELLLDWWLHTNMATKYLINLIRRVVLLLYSPVSIKFVFFLSPLIYQGTKHTVHIKNSTIFRGFKTVYFRPDSFIFVSVREMRMGNSPNVTAEDANGNKTESLLHPRIWLGGISQTSIMARIENLQRKKSSKTNEPIFDSSESFAISNGSNEAGRDKSRTNYSTTNESATNEITWSL